MNSGEGNGHLLQCSCLENPMDCSLPGSSAHGVARVGHDLVTKPPVNSDGQEETGLLLYNQGMEEHSVELRCSP